MESKSYSIPPVSPHSVGSGYTPTEQMSHLKPTLDVLPGDFAVCRFPPDTPVPEWAWSGEFVSVTRTGDELSLVCSADSVPSSVDHTAGWRGLKVQGPLDFSLVGILAGISLVLAEASVSIFAISTHDTDYILVRATQLDTAVDALRAAGYGVG